MIFPKMPSVKGLSQRLTFDGGVRTDTDSAVGDGQSGEMLNVQAADGGFCVRPSLRLRGSVPFDGKPDRFFAAGGKTVAAKSGDGISIAEFDRDGVPVRTAQSSAQVSSAVALVKGDDVRLYAETQQGGRYMTVYESGGETLISDPTDPRGSAYVPLISVGASGYAYSADDTVGSYRFNGKRYENKNLMSCKYRAAATTSDGKNVYPMPYPIGADTTVECQYTDCLLGLYLHSFSTDEDGKTDLDGEPDDVDNLWLDMFGDSRRAVRFCHNGGVSAEDDAPNGSERSNNMIFTVADGNGDTEMCAATRCCVTETGGRTTWLLYGSGKAKNVIWATAKGDMTYFPECGRISVGGSSEAVTAVVPLGDRLAVLKENSLWIAKPSFGAEYTDDELNGGFCDKDCGDTVGIVPRMVAETGCVSPDSACDCDGRLIWLGVDGVVRMMTAVAEPEKRDVKELSKAIAPMIKAHGDEDIKKASAAYVGGRYYLLIGSDLFVLDCRCNAMDNYSSYATDDRAQELLCWYIWNVAVEEVEWCAMAGSDAPILYGVRGNELICCALDGADGVDRVAQSCAHDVAWRVTSGALDFGSAADAKHGARLSANVMSQSDVHAVIIADGICGGCNEVRRSPNEPRCSEVICGKAAKRFQVQFSGSGNAAVTDVRLSARMNSR